MTCTARSTCAQGGNAYAFEVCAEVLAVVGIARGCSVDAVIASLDAAQVHRHEPASPLPLAQIAASPVVAEPNYYMMCANVRAAMLEAQPDNVLSRSLPQQLFLKLMKIPACEHSRERVKAASALVGSSPLDEASYELVVALMSHPIEE